MTNLKNYLEKLKDINKREELRKLVREYMGYLSSLDNRWKKKFTEWAKDEGLDGFSHGSITNLRNGHYGLKGNEENYDDLGYKNKVRNFIKKTVIFIKSEEYVGKDKKELNTIFDNTKWYVYFFYVVPPRERKVRLGRCVITLEEGGYAKMANIAGDNSWDKVGRYSLQHDTIFVDLWSSEAKEKHLHIKLNREAKPTTILLGGFVSREIKTITTGTLIFENITKESIAATPKVLCSQENRSEFLEVSSCIRDYLSSKRMNFGKIPNGIYSLLQLKDKIIDHKSNNFTRFFEPEEPVVYISSPVSKLSEFSKEVNLRKIAALRNELESQFKNYHLKTIFLSEKESHESDYFNVFNYLKKTTFFVFIYPELIVSNSLVELGIAMSHSKRLFLFSPKKILPNKIGNFARGNSQCSFCAIESVELVNQKDLTLERKEVITSVYNSNYDEIQRELKKEIMKFFTKEYRKST